MVNQLTRRGRLGLEIFAFNLIGSGVVRLLTPRRHTRRWAFGPWRNVALRFSERPTFMRVTGLIRIALGVWIAMRLAQR
jgi:hypothetical protein